MRLDRITSLFDDPGPFASAYAEVSRDQEDGDILAELAARAAYDELVEQGAPAEVATQVRERLAAPTHRPAPVSRCVVATERGVLLDELTSVHRAQPRHAWDALPDLAEWVQDASLVVPYVLALVDHEGGRVQTFAHGGPRADREAEMTDDSPWVQRVSDGGWSEARIQRSTDEVWAANAREVAEEVRRQVTGGPDLLVLAGDVRSRQLVEGELEHLRAEVVQLDRGGRAEDGGEAALQDEIREVLRGRLITSRLDRLHELGQQLGRGERMAVGVHDVAEAFVRGQVDTLYLDPHQSAEHELDPAAYPGLAFGAVTPTGPVRADRALVAAACLTDADVITAGTEHLFGTPVAAVLRWDQPG
jgi:Bacterial archaeo-eukaryotic release factor family 2